MTRNTFDNAYWCFGIDIVQIHDGAIQIISVACAVLMEAIFSCFYKDCNLATTIFIQNFSQLNEILILGKL